MHLCRGNRGGHWHAEGSYDSVAERLFNALEHPVLFPRIRLAARRHLHAAAARAAPQDRRARPRLDQDGRRWRAKDELKTRVDDATRILDLDRLAISPQCGFASVDTGNPITPQAQEDKLRLVVDLARDIWGEA